MKLLSTLISSLILPSALMVQASIVAQLRNEGCSAFADAVVKAGLEYAFEVNADDAVTLVIPSNDAFAQIKSITDGLNQTQLQYVLATHIIPSGALKAADVKSGIVTTSNPGQNLTVVKDATGITFNGAKVIKADNLLNNAVFHVIDKVILSSYVGATPLVCDIVDTAKMNNLTLLLDSLAKANLVDTIKKSSNVTVFAPTNAAFRAIESTTAKLTIQELQNVLLLHVTPVAYCSKTLPKGSIKTLNTKENLNVQVMNGKITVNGVSLIIIDVPTTQGIVHVVDKVIMPMSKDGGNLISSGLSLIASLGMIVPALIMMF